MVSDSLADNAQASPERLHPFYVKTFDSVMGTAAGEFEFYRTAAMDAVARGGRVLDVGCGTGRITLQMADVGPATVGMDLSPSILAAAREKTSHRTDVEWVQGDLVSFELGRRFDLITLSGYAFHYALTPPEQLSCLDCAYRHLQPEGVLVLHLNRVRPSWLAQLMEAQGTWSEELEPLRDPESGHQVRTRWTWDYEAKTETLFARATWEFYGDDEQLVERRESSPIVSHCYGRFEVEHLLARAGFRIEHFYGDFLGSNYADDSKFMIWLARRPGE